MYGTGLCGLLRAVEFPVGVMLAGDNYPYYGYGGSIVSQCSICKWIFFIYFVPEI